MEMIKTAVKPEIINALNTLYKLYLKSRTHLESKEISSDIGCQYRKSFGGLNCKMNQILIQDFFLERKYCNSACFLKSNIFQTFSRDILRSL